MGICNWIKKICNCPCKAKKEQTQENVESKNACDVNTTRSNQNLEEPVNKNPDPESCGL